MAMNVGYRTALRIVIALESKAYGFTLVVWGTGALTIDQHGPPGGPATVAFIGGLLGGVAVVAAIAFGGLRTTWSRRQMVLWRYAGGMVHVLSVGSAVTVGWLCAVLVTEAWLSYLTAGLGASTVYQLVLGIEVASTVPGDEEDPQPGAVVLDR